MTIRALPTFLHQNRNIALLNLHAALQRFSGKTLDVFGAVYFLSQGVSFPGVSLAWTASFLIRFSLRPICVWVASRIGLKKTLIFGTVFSSGLFLVIPLVHGINIWLYVFAFYLALYDIFYWLPYNSYFAAAGDEQDRGKQVAIRSSMIDIVQVVVPLFGAILATKFGFWSLYGAAMVCMVISAIPVLFARDVSAGEKLSFRDALKKIDKQGFIMQIGDGILGNGHSFLWTIVLFLLIGNLIGFGGLITFEILISTILSLSLGHFIDGGKGVWVNRLAMVLLAIVIISRSVWVMTIPQIILTNAVAAIAFTFFTMSYQVGIYNLAKRTSNTLWFHFFAESGWDVGGAIALLISAGLFALGIEIRYTMLFSLTGLVVMNAVLKKHYSLSKL